MKKNTDPEILFGRPGYIPLREYVEDIDGLLSGNTWKLPLPHRDRVLFFVLRVLSGIEWFSEVLYIKHSLLWSPSYGLLLAFLKKKHIIDACHERQLGYPGFFGYTITKQLHVGSTTKLLHANGVATSRSVAMSKAIGEMLERTITGFGDMTRNVVTASAEALHKQGRVFYPPKFHRFLPVQKARYPIFELSDCRMMTWVTGEDLISGEDVYIPKHITSWFFRPNEHTPVYFNPTTNGSALAFTRDTAILRGLLEVVQRDAFFVHWLTGTPPDIIDQETLPSDLRDLIEAFTSRGITLYILDTTTNIRIPSVCVIAISKEAASPGIVVSASTALGFVEAVGEALREMVICAESLSEEVAPLKTGEPFLSEIDKNTRLAYWRGKEKVHECDWFISGKKVSFDSLIKDDVPNKGQGDAEKLGMCLKILREAGPDYHPVVYEPKSPLAEMLGSCVAQVFIPKAFPLYLVEKYGTFDSDRLDEFATYKGRSSWKLTETPHMFV